MGTVVEEPGPAQALARVDELFADVTDPRTGLVNLRAQDVARYGKKLTYTDAERGLWFGPAGLDDVVGFFMSHILLSGNKQQIEKAWADNWTNALLALRNDLTPEEMAMQVAGWNVWMEDLQKALDDAPFDDPPNLRPFRPDGKSLQEVGAPPPTGVTEGELERGVAKQKKMISLLENALEKIDELKAHWREIAQKLDKALDVVMSEDTSLPTRLERKSDLNGRLTRAIENAFEIADDVDKGTRASNPIAAAILKEIEDFLGQT